MSERDVEIRFGPPGTGKTTSLIRTVREALEAGADPKRVAFTSFTRFAAQQGRAMAVEKLDGLVTDEDLPHFRTLHSMAYRQLGLAPTEVMDTAAYATVADACGLYLTGQYDFTTERVAPGGALGDAALRLYALSRARGTSLYDEWRLAPERELIWPTVKTFAAALAEYKREYNVIDFSDMLDCCEVPLDVDIAVIDEAQDLTLAQWNLARRLFRNASKIYIGGDDDQSLYDWAGATPEILTTLQGRRYVLPHSHRLPQRVKAVADQIRHSIRTSIPKRFSAEARMGSVQWIRDYDEVDLRGGGTWLLMCRHRHQIRSLVDMAREQGVVYRVHGEWSNTHESIRAAAYYERLRRGGKLRWSEAKLMAGYVAGLQLPDRRAVVTWDDFRWPFGPEVYPEWIEALNRMDVDDAEYLRALRRNGESLTKEGRVVISTIHGAKGGEAQNTLLVTDISAQTERGLLETPDNEHRVWYVGMTRASETVYLRFPTTQKFWSLPLGGRTRSNASKSPRGGAGTPEAGTGAGSPPIAP